MHCDFVKRRVIEIFLLNLHASLCLGLWDGLYCGKNNCYEVLGVSPDASKMEIGKAYRLLAKKFHPDMHRDEQAKQEAQEHFKLIATAYEVMKDEGTRNDYDYMLKNPDEYYAHYYHYYRRRVAPKVDVRLVIVVTLTVVSIIQYYSGWQRYDSAIKYLATVPKYRNRALEIAKHEINEKIYRKGKNRMSKLDQKEELERIIRKVIEEKMDVQGGYAKPTLADVIWVQLFIFPITMMKFLGWHLKWMWKYGIMKQPYGREEKLYLIRRYMQMGQHQFNAQDDKQIEEYLQLELWKKDEFLVWKEEMKKKMAENPRYKSYRRYMKNHGPGRITFED